ncbi:hypothetical protein GOBAR_AA27484 [Gossypium barbadense]|uniref:Uncharacterized protein n=1 Tax=Gossypium barbadense TaxID=3634 RepID=A0A2P5WQ31_GOSBA|nr:hypothetical protein GOBAR_AA27484 [Gossypium barbadense]
MLMHFTRQSRKPNPSHHLQRDTTLIHFSKQFRKPNPSHHLQRVWLRS